MKCEKCLCNNCMFTMPEGSITDCMNCEACTNGDLQKKEGQCEGFKGWNK